MRCHPANLIPLTAAVLLGLGWAARGEDKKESAAFFQSKVLPILESRCYSCHSAKAEKLKGGLRLDSRAGVLRGGDSGKAAIIPANPDHSPLIDAIRYTNRDTQMPPKEKLPESEIETIVAWVKMGAPDPRTEETAPQAAPELKRDHWAFQKLRPQAVPATKSSARLRTPVDAFVLAKLAEKKLAFSPEADRVTLLRRLYLDLIGLPPTPAQAQEFLTDKHPDAYERLVDRLLDSPHFGERWGRHWLDAAGYVDIMGMDNDADLVKFGDGKWRYRDYVIDSHNQDKSLNRFLIEQLAGDELVDWRNAETYTDELKRLLIATGFLRTIPDDTDEMEINTPDVRHDILQRTTEMVVGNLLGVTLACAKCHDHKYEPLPQRDYYRVAAILGTAYNHRDWPLPAKRALPDVPPSVKAEIDKHNAEVEQPLNELKKQRDEFIKKHQEPMLDQRLLTVPESIRADLKAALRLPIEKRNDIQKYLVERFGYDVRVRTNEVIAALMEPAKSELANLDKKIEQQTSLRKSHGLIQAVYDSAELPVVNILYRGNFDAPGAVVEPGFLSVLCESDAASLLAQQSAHSHELQPAGKSSGRRLAFAQWLTRPDTSASALLNRVYVNRVWMHLFGKGIVETADNFGVTGAAPSHPELLEWLTQQFVKDGSRLKPLIRLLVTSSTYRQTATMKNSSPGLADEIDPDNKLLWRQRLRRLEAEIVRDSVLAASGQIDLSLGGKPVFLQNNPDGSFTIKEQDQPPSSKVRRSLYLLVRRNYPPSFLATFDQPVISSVCSSRQPSAVALQALTMLNDKFVLDQADAFARRIDAAESNPKQRIELAFQIALTRPPTSREISWALELLEQQRKHYLADSVPPAWIEPKAWMQFCHALFNTSEFLYTP